MTNHGKAPVPIQNENDFKRKQTELKTLTEILAEKELELASLENELRAFELQYIRTVGVLLAKLDQIEEDIAQELFQKHPEERFKREYETAQRKAKDSQQAVNEKLGDGEKKVFTSSDELRSLYIRVAKSIHPDLATNEDEISVRTLLMARANEAFANGDKEYLERILLEWELQGEKSVPEETVSSKIELLEKKINQIKLRIRRLEIKIEELKKSELNQLRLKVEQAKQQGRDLLQEMKEDIQRQIEEQVSFLSNLKQREKDINGK